MSLAAIAKLVVLTVLVLPGITGCAAKNTYRMDRDPDIVHSRFAIIQNYGTAPVDPRQVDALMMEVAALLGVAVEPSVRKVRIVITAPQNIDGLARVVAARSSENWAWASHRHGYAEAAYLPKVSVILIPYFDRIILGHELAHYLTDHYLKQVPLAQWEEVADRVERKLWVAKPAPLTPAAPTLVAAEEPAAMR